MVASSVGSEHQEGVISVVAEADEIVAVCLAGEFDLADARTLGDEIDHALEGGNNLILDLSEATFIDSSVIHVLMRAVRAVREREQTAVLQLGTEAIVERALEISRIDQVLPRVHDRQGALQLIKRATAGEAGISGAGELDRVAWNVSGP